MRINLTLVCVLAGAATTSTGCPSTAVTTETDDTTGGCTPGQEDCVCTSDKTCDGNLVCASNVCIALDTTTTPTSETSEHTTATDDPSMSSETTETTETTHDPTDETTTTEGPMCESDAECSDPTTPYCRDEMCVSCSELSGGCGEISADTPVCDDESGVCVPCTDSDDSYCAQQGLICADNTCQPCSEHGQCDSGACDIKVGECFPNQGVWVDKMTTDCNGATGTPAKPFCEIADAIGGIGANSPTIVWVQPTGTYVKPTTVSSNRVVAFLRAPEASGAYTIVTTAADPPLTILSNSRVYLENLEVTSSYNNAPSPSIGCYNAEVWVSKSDILLGKSQGVYASDCATHIRDTRIYDNHRGGVEIDGGTAEIANSFIVANGGSQGTPNAGVELLGDASVEIVYTTIVNNLGWGEVNPDVLRCQPAVEVSVRNSILLGSGYSDLIECAQLMVGQSVIDASNFMGNGNKSYGYTVSGANVPTWFVNPDSGDYHLSPEHDFTGVAVWNTGDPMTDYDGDARPTNDGASDFPGADVP